MYRRAREMWKWSVIGGAICLVVVGASPGLARASDWEVIAERDGIVVSRRPVEGRGLPQLRSVGEVPGTPYEVLAVLLDVPAQVDWRPDCVESSWTPIRAEACRTG